MPTSKGKMPPFFKAKAAPSLKKPGKEPMIAPEMPESGLGAVTAKGFGKGFEKEKRGFGSEKRSMHGRHKKERGV